MTLTTILGQLALFAIAALPFAISAWIISQKTVEELPPEDDDGFGPEIGH